MGNNISQISIACGLVTAEELQTERQDVCAGTAGRLPADHDDFAPRLASLAIPLPRRFHLGARRGSQVHEALRDAINLLSEVAHSADAVSGNPQLIESRVRALSLLMRLGAFDRVVLPRPIETEDSYLVVLQEDTPQWLHALFAQAEAWSRARSEEITDPLREQLSRLGVTQIDLEELHSEIGGAKLVVPVLRDELDKVRHLLAQGCDPDARDPLGRTALHAAAITGSGRIIGVLCEAGATLDMRDHQQRTPLELAILSKKLGALAALIRGGVPVNQIGQRGLTPLGTAVAMDFGEAIHQLLVAGADPDLAGAGGTPIHHAIFSGNANTLRKLLQFNASPMTVSSWREYVTDNIPKWLRDQTLTPPECAALTGQARLFNLLLSYGADVRALLDNNRPLMCRAAIGGSLTIIDALIKAGASVDEADADGRTALQWAAAKGSAEVFQHLLKRGANPLVQDKVGGSLMHATVAGVLASGTQSMNDTLIKQILSIEGVKIDARNSCNQTPLHLAASGDRALIDLLVKAGANLEAKDDQRRTSLHFAAKDGNPVATAALLAHGADHRAKDCYGQTPLHIAAERNQLSVVRILLDKGANSSEFNNLGLLPVHIAAYRGDIDMLELLCSGRAELLSKPGRAGATALRVARNRGKTECAAWIEAKIADAATSSSTPRRAQVSRSGRPVR